jgi:hypothetical protein
MNNCYYCHFSALKFVQQPEREESLFAQGQGAGLILKIHSLLEKTLQQLNDNVVTPKVDVLVYDVLNKAEKHMPYGELVGTTKCVTL